MMTFPPPKSPPHLNGVLKGEEIQESHDIGKGEL